VGYPVVHFEINTSRGSELARFYSTAFGWEAKADGDDYFQISTRGVCAGTGAPGIDGGIELALRSRAAGSSGRRAT
jgi:predicted enzyme related to lactoylglutathione lyase